MNVELNNLMNETHTVSTFTVEVRGNKSAEEIKNLIEKKWEVVKIEKK